MADDAEKQADPARSWPSGTRRRFSDKEKLRILEAADRCARPGELGLLLRREGIYSSHLATWRRWRRRAHPEMEQSQQPPTESQLRHDMERLERENVRLRLKLEHADKLLALQKKMADMMEAIDRSNQQDRGSGASDGRSA
jgi:transposase-like protein